MNYIGLENVKRYDDFIEICEDGITVVFSTAENERSFNRNTDEGVNELNKLVNEFNVNSVQYLKQIHSKNIFSYTKEKSNFKDNEGDAIITNEKNTIIGVFTADCVPVILVDKKKKVVGAIHSGWKGTFESIVKETVYKMINEYDVNVNDIKAYIGPHIRECCYEVSEELIDKFKNKFKNENINSGRHLNMEKCIISDLVSCGVKDENIFAMNLCTYCSNEVKLHSYRKSSGAYGRLFSFVYVK